VLGFLRLGAVVEDRRADHGDAHAEEERVEGAGLAHFLGQHAGLRAGEATAAVLGGPGGRGPALLADGLAPGRQVGALALAFGHGDGAFAGQGLGEVRLQPGLRLAAEVLELVVGSEVGHVASPALQSNPAHLSPLRPGDKRAPR